MLVLGCASTCRVCGIGLKTVREVKEPRRAAVQMPFFNGVIYGVVIAEVTPILASIMRCTCRQFFHGWLTPEVTGANPHSGFAESSYAKVDTGGQTHWASNSAGERYPNDECKR